MIYKILYISANTGSVFGGGSRVFFNLITSLNKNMFKPIVLCSDESLFSKMLQKAGVRVLPLDIHSQFDLKAIRRVIKIVKLETPSIIHCLGGGRADFIAANVIRYLGLKNTITTVAVFPEDYNVHKIKKIVYHIVDRFSKNTFKKHITVSCAINKRLISEYYIHKDRVVTIYNGIDVNIYKADRDSSLRSITRKDLKIDGKEIAIGVVGRLVWEKGIEYLLEAVSMLKTNKPNIRLVITGEGPLKNKLVSLAKSFKIDGMCKFTGFKKDVAMILDAIDIMIIPSLSEGFPMIVLESMAMNKPIIATNIKGIVEQIENEKSGLLINPRSPNEIANAIEELIANPLKAKKLGIEARKKVVKDFSLEKMVADTERVYLSLVQS